MINFHHVNFIFSQNFISLFWGLFNDKTNLTRVSYPSLLSPKGDRSRWDLIPISRCKIPPFTKRGIYIHKVEVPLQNHFRAFLCVLLTIVKTSVGRFSLLLELGELPGKVRVLTLKLKVIEPVSTFNRVLKSRQIVSVPLTWPSTFLF